MYLPGYDNLETAVVSSIDAHLAIYVIPQARKLSLRYTTSPIQEKTEGWWLCIRAQIDKHVNLKKLVLFQLNISYPATGCQKLIEVDDERKVRIFYEKRMSQEVAIESLGDEWKVTLSYCHWKLFWQ